MAADKGSTEFLGQAATASISWATTTGIIGWADQSVVINRSMPATSSASSAIVNRIITVEVEVDAEAEVVTVTVAGAHRLQREDSQQ